MTRRTIGIIDYGAGNLSSVARAFQSLGHRCRTTADKATLDAVDLLVLPGVGAFPHAMAAISASGLDDYLVRAARSARPILGICLGMQLLLDRSDELQPTTGLGLVPGSVRALSNGGWHIGWNRLETALDDPLLRPSDGAFVYFNHGFAADVPERYAVAVARDREPIVAAIRRGTVVGLQFHPEKSQGDGRALLARIVEALVPESSA